MYLQCGKFRLPLAHPLIMGVVNLTPDSFSDAGKFATPQAAVAQAHRLCDEGADIIDIGGESTRPGASGVTLEAERRRVLPVLEQLAAGPVPVSVDTQKPALMRDAIAAGASMINDINALLAPGAIAAVAASDVALCLMHKQGTPASMQVDPHYDDVVAEVLAFLSQRAEAVRAAGVAAERIVIDPGFGFGKTLEHNLELLRRLERFAAAGPAVLAGISRKSMLGRLTGRAVEERVYASVAAALIAAQKGARILRVHDVAATRDAIAVWRAVQGENL
ncbi:MAG: dihydropteroate synthase [Betaproteobacteria bacterium]|nr:dihydropteroate synthase [Betaproteobacteria bacterium]MBI2290519.1 dihydropteroate synthase [Betaproteobacteria bacterium]MBI3056007.1 dihydropteroate synthase [Betaproteobacteria bacterium]